MDRIVIVVNGYAQSGKDTAIGFMSAKFEKCGYATSAFSSIDPVRDALKHMGIDVSRKTNADRDLMAGIGDLVEEHCHYRSEACIQAAQKSFVGHVRAVIFLHTREPKIIARIEQGVENFARSYTLLVQRPGIVKVERNASDRNVETIDYDLRLVNDGSIADLDRMWGSIVEQLSRN